MNSGSKQRRVASVGLVVAWCALVAGCQTQSKSAGELILKDTAPSDSAVAATTPPQPASAAEARIDTTGPAPVVATTAPVVVTTAPAPQTRAIVATPVASAQPPVPTTRATVAAGPERSRTWEPVVCYYQNGDTIAGPVYRINPPAPKNPSEAVFMDFYGTVLTIPQVLITPFWVFITPPSTAIRYHGDEIPLSYTVDTVLPYYETEKVPGQIQLQRR